MGVYIKSMEMPKEPIALIIYPDGKVFRVSHPEQIAEAVPVPPHGRCIDADALVKEKYRPYGAIDSLALDAIKAAPTVIPAEADEEQREYEAAVEAAQYCEMYEPTYDPETGAL